MKSKDGKRNGSSFRMHKYDSEHEGKEPGPRSEAHKIMASTSPDGHESKEPKESKEPGEGKGPSGEPWQKEENLEEQIHPGIHDAVKQMAAEHGPAHTIHITHDHASGMHHVHHVHSDGFEHHADHPTADHAHMHAAHAAGVQIPGMENPEDSMAHHGTEAEDEYEPAPLE